MGYCVSSDVQQLDHVHVIPSSVASYCHIPGFSVFTLKGYSDNTRATQLKMQNVCQLTHCFV